MSFDRLQARQRGGTIAGVTGDSRTIRIIRADLKARAEVLDAYVFGSVARGDAGAHSDVDVAVYVADDILRDAGDFGYASVLATDLMKELGSNAVDVVVLNDAPPLLYHRVLRDGVRIITRDLAATTTREGYALSRYCDYVVQLRKIRDAMNARVERDEFGR